METTETPLAHAEVISLIQQIASALSYERVTPWKPGKGRKPYLCVHCRGIFTSRGLRYHRSRCGFNPANQLRVVTDIYAPIKPLTPSQLRSALLDIEAKNVEHPVSIALSAL